MVYTGHRTLKELYRDLGTRSGDDFGAMRLQVVPKINSQVAGLVGNELCGVYGHVDKACIWGSTQAVLEALGTKSPNTMMVFYLDCEEVGGQGSSSAYRGMTEAVIKETLKVILPKKDYGEIDLPLDLYRGLMGGAPALVADVFVGVGLQEVQSEDVNNYDAAKLGWGVCISNDCSNWMGKNESPLHGRMVLDMLESAGVCEKRRQVVGSGTTADSGLDGSASMADILYRDVPCLDVGMAVKGLHDPTGESLNVYDLNFFIEGMIGYLTSNIRYR